jgi:hypothetical protein
MLPVSEISEGDIPLTSEQSGAQDGNQNDAFKGTQNTGSLPGSDDTSPIFLVIGGIAVLAVAAGTGTVLLFRRNSMRVR